MNDVGGGEVVTDGEKALVLRQEIVEVWHDEL